MNAHERVAALAGRRRLEALRRDPEQLREAAGEHVETLAHQPVADWLDDLEPLDPEAHGRVMELLNGNLKALNFDRHLRAHEQVKDLVGEEDYKLLEYMNHEEWFAEMERRAPETLVRLRKFNMQHERDSDPDFFERRANIAEAMAEIERPLHPDVDRGIPATAKGFDSFEPRLGYPAVKAALDAVSVWTAGGGVPMLTLQGTPGTGKTHLAASAAVSRADSLCFYRTETEFFGEILARMKTRTSEALLDAFCKASWVVLDDLGLAPLNEWQKVQLDRLIDARYVLAQQGNGRTLFTTNIRGEELQATLPRIFRRLTEPGVSQILQVQAPMYFRKGGEGGDTRRTD